MTTKKQVYRTYGRHRQRVVTVNIWNDNETRQLFSSSGESHNDTSNICSSFVSATSVRLAGRSSLRETTGRANKITKRKNLTKILKSLDKESTLENKSSLDAYGKHFSPVIFDSGEQRSRAVLRSYDTNRPLAVRHKQARKKQSVLKIVPTTHIKSKHHVPNYASGKSSTNHSNANTSSLESCCNFSQFDSYDLIVDSSPEVVSSGNIGSRNESDAHIEEPALHSTPHSNKIVCSEVCSSSADQHSTDHLDDFSISNISFSNTVEQPLKSTTEAKQIDREANLSHSKDSKVISPERSNDLTNTVGNSRKKLCMLSYTEEYNASKSLFDGSSFGVQQHTNHLSCQKLRGKMSSPLVICISDSSCNTTPDMNVLSDTASEDSLDSDKSVSSPVHSGSNFSSCHNQSGTGSPLADDLDQLLMQSADHSLLGSSDSDMFSYHMEEKNDTFSSSRQLNRGNTGITPRYTFNALEQCTPVRKSSACEEWKTPLMSLERQKKLIQEIHNSGISVQVLLTPLKLPAFISAKDKVLYLCQQVKPITFMECIPPVLLKKCRKVGEGVYGEVFISERKKEQIALKIIPIEGNFLVNGEQQKTYEEVLPEIIITKELSALQEAADYQTPSFVNLKKTSLVCGRYPPTLIKQWDIFHKAKGSENDRPDIYNHDQLFVVFEFEDCGVDLSAFELSSIQQVKSIIHQVVSSLAVAETALQFEHRDLHWGNILVKPTKCNSFSYLIQGQHFKVKSHGVKVSIIDFTLSRLSKDGCNIFTDLSTDQTLFEGYGDYQFEVYRLMKVTCRNNWEPFEPFTNVLWIKYLTDKLLNHKTNLLTKGKQGQTVKKQLKTLLKNVLCYRNARHLLENCPIFKECL